MISTALFRQGHVLSFTILSLRPRFAFSPQQDGNSMALNFRCDTQVSGFVGPCDQQKAPISSLWTRWTRRLEIILWVNWPKGFQL